MQKHVRWLTPLLFVAVTSVWAGESSTWQMVPDSSAVRFIGSQEGSSFRGRFENFTAMIDFDPANPADGKIIGVVTMNSAKSGDEERDSTLMEEDWFNPDVHPESRFESESIEQLEDGSFAAHGQLTMIGVTNPVTMEFEFEQKDSTANFAGTFEVKRLEFGMGWEATNWIADEVGVQVRLKLQK